MAPSRFSASETRPATLSLQQGKIHRIFIHGWFSCSQQGCGSHRVPSRLSCHLCPPPFPPVPLPLCQTNRTVPYLEGLGDVFTVHQWTWGVECYSKSVREGAVRWLQGSLLLQPKFICLPTDTLTSKYSLVPPTNLKHNQEEPSGITVIVLKFNCSLKKIFDEESQI